MLRTYQKYSKNSIKLVIFTNYYCNISGHIAQHLIQLLMRILIDRRVRASRIPPDYYSQGPLDYQSIYNMFNAAQ